MNHFRLLLLICTLSGLSFSARAITNVPDTTLNLLDKGIVAAKMVDGKNKFYTKNYRGALTSFREVLSEDANHPLAHYFIALSHFHLANYELAKEYIDKSINLKSEAEDATYYQALILHRLEKLDDAIALLEKFRETLTTPAKQTEYSVDFYINQLKSAKTKMANPVKAEIMNGGRNINSRFDDYSPIFSPDGKVMYFTSRRPQGIGGTEAEDNQYFEDIYFSKKQDDGTWSEAESVEGKLNTDEYDNCSHISADGTVMYITQNISGHTKSSDIAVAKMSRNGTWGMAKLMTKGINTTYFDACPTLTQDEKTMYFVSERAGEKFGSDIYKINKISGSKWGEPISCTTLNSPENETTVWLHPNGQYLFFSSKGFDSMGGYDIFMSKFAGTNWEAPVNLGYPINSVNDDTHFRISPDGKTAVYASIRPNGVGDRDIYTVDISQIPALQIK
jgi:Tol biopolymer transport system component